MGCTSGQSPGQSGVRDPKLRPAGYNRAGYNRAGYNKAISKEAAGATTRNKVCYVASQEARAGSSLPGRKRLRRLYRQLQHFAQCRKILGTRPCSAHFPKVDARSAYADTLGNFCDRQAALDASVTKVFAQTWLTRHRSTSQLSGLGGNVATIYVHGKTCFESFERSPAGRPASSASISGCKS